jgi:hypothetical protein
MLSRRSQSIFAALLVFFAAGCATPGAIVSENVSSIRSGISAADIETAAVFDSVNAQARIDTIDRLVLAKQGPAEKEFSPVLDDETAQRWTAAYGAMDSYLAGLQRLVSDGPSQDITDDLSAIGATLGSDNFGVNLPDGTAQLFANLGGSLVQAAAEMKAQTIMQRTNPSFAALTRSMADLVHPPSGAPIRGTLLGNVDTHWTNRLAGVENSYRRVAEAGPDDRRAVLVEYGQTIDQRDAEILRLRRLRQAILALAEAHASASQGNTSGLLFWLDQLDRQLEEARNTTKGG